MGDINAGERMKAMRMRQVDVGGSEEVDVWWADDASRTLPYDTLLWAEDSDA